MSEAQDLVRNLLVAHPDNRMTAQAALVHPWLYGYEPYKVSFASVPLLSPPVTEQCASNDFPVAGKGKAKMQPQLMQPKETRLRSGRVV